MDDRACREGDLDEFFAVEKDRQERAKAFCLSECKVRMECLGYVLANENGSPRYGIFAGLGPAQRRSLQKKIDDLAARELAQKQKEEKDEQATS